MNGSQRSQISGVDGHRSPAAGAPPRGEGGLARSLGLLQATVVLLASLGIGLALGLLQLGYILEQQREAALALLDDVVTSAEGGAASAAWTLDTRLAEEVIGDIMAIRGVSFAQIVDDHGERLARASKEPAPQSWLAAWLVADVIGDEFRDSRVLYAAEGGRRSPVGVLGVALTPHHVADRFVNVAASSLLSDFVSALLIGAVLLWVSARTVTRPLRQAAEVIAGIDPDNPGAAAVPVPALHRHNELGHLLAHTNKMLVRLKASRDKLELTSTRDALTGLPNRSLVRERLQNAIARAERHAHGLAVLYLDLDRFKNVNDLLGHDTGDELLKTVAESLGATLRSSDTVGRLGGDEFLVLLEHVSGLEEVMRAVQRIVNALSACVTPGARGLATRASIGIAMYPEDGGDSTTLMRHAELAMDRAKAEPATPWHFYSEDIREHVQSRLRLEQALAAAVAAREFELFLQPKLDATGGELAGCEALLRWRHVGRWVPAGEFIGVLEELPLIHDVGRWVIEESCRILRAWGPRAVPIAVNVSARQLTDTGFADHLLTTLDRLRLPPRLLEIEMTETALVRDLDHCVDLLGRLREQGVYTSIDDFGTGYSSLAYLSRLPIAALKIDRAFVSGAQRSPAMLNTIVAMARSMGLRTVAEGVETAAQLAEVRQTGCDLAQGYLLGEPVPVEEFEQRHMDVADLPTRTAL